MRYGISSMLDISGFCTVFFNCAVCNNQLMTCWSQSELFCWQLIGQSCGGDVTLVEMLVNNLLGRMVDSELTVRMLCIRGLGNVSAAGPALVYRQFEMFIKTFLFTDYTVHGTGCWRQRAGVTGTTPHSLRVSLWMKRDEAGYWLGSVFCVSFCALINVLWVSKEQVPGFMLTIVFCPLIYGDVLSIKVIPWWWLHASNDNECLTLLIWGIQPIKTCAIYPQWVCSGISERSKLRTTDLPMFSWNEGH